MHIGFEQIPDGLSHGLVKLRSMDDSDMTIPSTKVNESRHPSGSDITHESANSYSVLIRLARRNAVA